jgi:hypothetical protein
MSDDRKKESTKVVIRDLTEEWGDNFSLIMFPDPVKCPKCRSRDIQRLEYGFPAEELSEDEQEDYRLGGCMVREEQWHCGTCSFEWPQHTGVIMNPDSKI